MQQTSPLPAGAELNAPVLFLAHSLPWPKPNHRCSLWAGNTRSPGHAARHPIGPKINLVFPHRPHPASTLPRYGTISILDFLS